MICVCQAVQHAHQKGVLHRDLKPSNVLVGVSDGKPIPKVIDFGLAKSLQQPLTERTLVTGIGSLVGTLEYMSPEQASLNPHDVDTRSDVYALGVMLYELLTGSTPLGSDRLRRLPLFELLLMIREEEPARLGARLVSSGQLASLAAERGTDGRRLTRQVTGELEWIVWRALEKDRERRYDSPGAIAEDLRRYLADEPVMASPLSRRYRLSKFIRRHRVPVLAAMLLLLTLMAGIAGTTWGLVRAVRSLQAETVARKQTFAALETLSEDVLEDLLGRRTSWGEKEKKYLLKLKDQFEKLAATEGETPAVRTMRAQALFRLGSIQATFGDEVAAEGAYRAARAECELLQRLTPADPSPRVAAARAISKLANLFVTTGRVAEALPLFRQACQEYEALATDFPDDPMHRFDPALAHNSMGLTLYLRGRFAEAEAEYRKALGLFSGLLEVTPANARYRQENARTTHNLAVLLSKTRRAEEADRILVDVIAVLTKLTTESPEDPLPQRDLAQAHQSRFGQLARQQQFAKAETNLRQAMQIQSRLVADYPAIPQYRGELAQQYHNLAALHEATNRPKDAMQAISDAVTLHARLAADYPKVVQHRTDLARSRTDLGALLLFAGRVKEAIPHLRDALSLWERLFADAPQAPGCLASLTRTLTRMGAAVSRDGQPTQGLAFLERAEKLRQANPKVMVRELTRLEDEQQTRSAFTKTLFQLGKYAQVASRSEALGAAKDDPGGAKAYDAGCYLALAAGKARDDRTLAPSNRDLIASGYEDRAMHFLRQAVTRGFNKRQHYEKDSDLVSLRGRDDFRTLVAGLK